MRKTKRKSFINLVEQSKDSSSENEFDASSASPATEHLPLKIKNRFCRSLNALEEAKIRLHTSEIPERLLKRENEYKEIYDFVLEGISNKVSQALYISGVPGTGKTASVLKVIFIFTHYIILNF